MAIGRKKANADIDQQSGTWQAVATWARQEIESARSGLEQVGQSQAESDRLRGRIEILRSLLNLVAEAPEFPEPQGYL